MGRAEDIFTMLVEGGRGAIESFIRDRASEELFLDFKRSADNGGGTTLHARDRANLAKAISGFGNSEGGVIVWGVDCSPNQSTADVATQTVPIHLPARFKSWLEGSVSGLTIPPHGTVQHHVTAGEEEDSGFVVTLVPQSNHAPHQVANDKRYYMRAGSDFLPVPHAVLAGMFGRRPQPHVFNMYFLDPPRRLDLTPPGISQKIGICIHNKGPGIAEDIFLNVMMWTLPGDNCRGEYTSVDASIWIGRMTLGRKMSVISRPEIRLPPDAEIIPFELTLTLTPPFRNSLHVSGVCGCSGAPAHGFEVSLAAEEIDRAVAAFLGDDCREHIDALFNPT